VVPAATSWTKTSQSLSVSAGSRFVAVESKATSRPSAETLGASAAPLAVRVTGTVVPVRRSRRWISRGWLPPRQNTNATERPSEEIAGSSDRAPRASAGRGTSSVRLRRRSRTYTSRALSRSSGCRFEARDSNATKRPSAEIDAFSDRPLPWAPRAPDARLMSSVRCVHTSRTNTSSRSSRSAGCRFEASEWKATNCPFPDTDGS
jgi:hypothetical protein